MGNQYSCEPGQHDFSEMSRLPFDDPEPHRLYCHKCAWVRDVPTIDWCAVIECPYIVPGARHEAHALAGKALAEVAVG